MSDEDHVIVTKGLTKEYPFGEATIKAINGIDFAIDRGEYATIVGPSGSGKTTFLNLIGSIDTPTSGEIIFNGKKISEMTGTEVRELRRTKVGFVFQAFNLLEILTASENIALPMIINGTPAREREERVQELLEIIGLPDRGNHFPMELSGGQRQRIAIARALANKPEVILLDEPTGQLDSNTSREIMDYLVKINKEENVTLIVVTHEDSIAAEAKRPLTIIDGKIYEGILESFLDIKAIEEGTL
ncbi:MAG: ABC transporter ATP-binding protein [Candidatus Heimdallarchaeota archaeon]|nr:ABC transporter ATP-binding protein [Candidatus Heimdallarchaeota archaeon]MBY8993462.1 ABC transporter ATP-binding protein [Candidatus Heimdallarchaeota archaeon]